MKSYDYRNRTGVNRISWEAFQQMCMRLAEKIAAENVSLVLGVARDGLYTATLISGMLQKEFYPLRITRRENDLVRFERPLWKATHSWSNPKPDYFCLESDELLIFPWDTQIFVNDGWQLHPELQEALKNQQ